MHWVSIVFVSGVVLFSALLLTCRDASRQTYRVSEEQLIQMGQIAGIKPCPDGPTIVAAVKRAKDGGVVHVECPLAGHTGR